MDSPRTPRGLSSPEAKIGLRVEDLWYVQEPMLSPSEKLNSCFESIPVSSFPSAPPSLDERVVKMLDVGESSAMEVKTIASKALPLEEETTTTTENRSLMVDTITSSMTVRGADFVHADRLSTELSTSNELLKINEELVEAREACRNLGGASDCKR